MRNITFITAAAALALGVAACSDNTADAPAEDTMATDTAMTDSDVDNAYPVGGELSADQQGRYDAMDRQAVSDEYDSNRDAMMQGAGASTGDTMSGDSMSGNASSNSGNSMSSDSGNMSGNGGNMSGNSGNMSNSSMPSRANMDFAFLDRNGDGQLSVAEYAIWAAPANPNTSVQNDNTRPYISQDAINTAGQTFFYFDQDGNSYLSPTEYQAARDSSRTPGGSGSMSGSMESGSDSTM